MTSRYAIDRKKQKAQSASSLPLPARVPVEQALATLSLRLGSLRPTPAKADAAAALARLEGFVAAGVPAGVTPDREGIEALWAVWGSSMERSAKCSLFCAWLGPRAFLAQILGAGRYVWEPAERTLRVGGRAFTRHELLAAIEFVLREAPELREEARAACKAAPLPRVDRTGCASLFDDHVWADSLVREWIESGISQQDAWAANELLGMVGDAALLGRFVEAFGSQIQHIGGGGRMSRALDRLPAGELGAILVGLLDRGTKEKWKSSNVEPYAKVLAHLHGAEPARALASWVGEKSVAKIAADYFRTHPDLAAAALGPVSKSKGKAGPIARAMLDSIARTSSPANSVDSPAERPKTKTKASGKPDKPSEGSAKDYASPAKASDEPPKKPAKATANAPAKTPTPLTHAPVSGDRAVLPEVLREPPWLAKVPTRARPRLALELIVDPESFSPRALSHIKAPPPDRSAESDARLLDGRPPSELYEGLVMGLTDEVGLAALRDRPFVAPSRVEGFALWLGEAVTPLAIRTIALNVGQSSWLLPRARSSRLALPCVRAALKRSAGHERPDAVAWLAKHPELTALGLIPAALGEDAADADLAEKQLRALVREGRGDVVSAAARRYGPEAERALAELLSRSAYDRFPAKLPTKAAWSLPARAGTLEIAGLGPLSDAEGLALIQMLQFSPPGEPYQGALDTIALATPASREALARALFAEYLLAGSPPSHEWTLAATALLAPHTAIELLGAHMRRWAADGKVPLLHRSLEVLATIGTDEALIVVYDAGQRSRYDDTRDKVRALLEALASERGITYEVLEDLLVPELGLEGGAISLDLGADGEAGRRLTVRLGDHLEAVLADERGAVLPSFPRKTKRDDPARYDGAKARHAALVEASEAVGKGQILRLERAMRVQRTWTLGQLRDLVLPQPLVQHLARRLVWHVVGGEVLFRVAEDLTLASADDELLPDPPRDTVIAIAHPVMAPGLGSFRRWIEDYKIIQPFAQVGREVFPMTPELTKASSFEGASGRTATYLSVLALTLGMGWKPIPPGNKGIDAITFELPGERVARLAISPGLLFGAAKGRPAQTLGALTLEDARREPASFGELTPLVLSELLRDVMTLG